MKEKIAKILTRFEGTAFYPYSSSVVEALSQEILALISEEIEKAENTARFYGSSEVVNLVEEFRKKILPLFKNRG